VFGARSDDDRAGPRAVLRRYGQKKNALTTIMHSFICMALVSVQWVVVGYSLAFGPDKAGLIGGLEWAGLRGVGLEPVAYAPTIPHQAFMMFQLMFAIIAPALITGAFAERMKFSAYIVFALAWTTLVYDPVAHWVWADGGWLRSLGAIDFAGGTVVHLTSGVSALVAVLIIGSRTGWGEGRMVPHSLPLTITGAACSWFGWFGFNAAKRARSKRVARPARSWRRTPRCCGDAHVDAYGVARASHTVGDGSGKRCGGWNSWRSRRRRGYVTPISALLSAGHGRRRVLHRVSPESEARNVHDSLDVVGVHGVGGLLGRAAHGRLCVPS
jgi:Amt family ammonium transporter